MLIGKYKNSIDIKNRICIPHKFRGDIGGRCVLSRDMTDNCLNLYPLEQWDIFSKKIEELPTIKMKRVRQLIYSNSDEVELDSQGRIILNQQICEKTGLLAEKEAMIIGTLSHVQIWSLSEWKKFEEDLNSGETKESVINDLLEIGF